MIAKKSPLWFKFVSRCEVGPVMFWKYAYNVLFSNAKTQMDTQCGTVGIEVECHEIIMNTGFLSIRRSSILQTVTPVHCYAVDTWPYIMLVYPIKVQYAIDSLNSSRTLTEGFFTFYIDVVNTFYSIFPGSVVTKLLDPLLARLAKSSLLVNNSNLEVRYSYCWICTPV